MMTFDELCGSALGAADYTAISEAFHTLFVHGVPMMNLVHINQAREGARSRGREEARKQGRGEGGEGGIFGYLRSCFCLPERPPTHTAFFFVHSSRLV